MRALYPSQEWCDEWKKAINAHPSIKELGKSWGVNFNGNLVFELKPGAGLENTAYLFVEAKAGECTNCRTIDNPAEVDYGFYVTGNYSDFKEVVRGNSGFMEGVVKGTFKVKGPMLRIMQNAKFIRAVADTISSFEAQYLGE